MLIFHIIVIVSNSNYLRGTKDNHVAAGVLGLFCSLIGGIFVLVAKREQLSITSTKNVGK